jgi:hypothetical protein
MSASDTVDLVKRILRESEELREWYKKEHKFTEDMVNIQTVSSQKSPNPYEVIVQFILRDGLDNGIITKEEYEKA